MSSRHEAIRRPLEEATSALTANAMMHRHQHSDLRMLVEEVGELAEALAGDHEHEPEDELVQIGGIVLHWLINIHYPLDPNWD